MATYRLRALVFLLLLLGKGMHAQDLDPRAYVWTPEHLTFITTGFSYTSGPVISDPALLLQDVTAHIQMPIAGLGHSFRLFGQTATAVAMLPYAWAQIEGNVGEIDSSTTRAGLSDMRLRFTWLFSGAPAASPMEIMKAPRKTILGASLSISAPTGEYIEGKLINIGNSRWAFKPELAISHPIGERWLLDLYAGVWFFTPNNRFFPGEAVRNQTPLGAWQGHISYTIKPRLWVAFDATYYTGGEIKLDGLEEIDSRQSNLRFGWTFVFPVRKMQSIKLAASSGAIVRSGGNFTTLSVGWQTSLYNPPKPPQPEGISPN